jgi:hypothetical protein
MHILTATFRAGRLSSDSDKLNSQIRLLLARWISDTHSGLVRKDPILLAVSSQTRRCQSWNDGPSDIVFASLLD